MRYNRRKLHTEVVTGKVNPYFVYVFAGARYIRKGEVVYIQANNIDWFHENPTDVGFFNAIDSVYTYNTGTSCLREM